MRRARADEALRGALAARLVAALTRRDVGDFARLEIGGFDRVTHAPLAAAACGDAVVAPAARMDALVIRSARVRRYARNIGDGARLRDIVR